MEQTLFRFRWLQHGIFWVASYFILLKVFAFQGKIMEIDWIYTGMFHLSLVVLVYVQTRVVIPFFLKKNKYLVFVLSSLLLIGACAALNRGVMDWLSPKIFTDYYFISGLSWPRTFGILFIYTFLATLFKMSKSWVQLQINERKLAEVEKVRQTVELNSLKAQIHPHFMMNTLNNIYGMALENNQLTADAILKLSNSMQYLLYKTNQTSVLLSDEIDFLDKYIDLEKMRSDYPGLVEVHWEGKYDDVHVPPLLLLPLIENVFKHGEKDKRISIVGTLKDKQMTLRVENAADRSQTNGLQKGIGLDNLKKRLTLLFPKNHELLIDHQKDFFKAKMSFPISQFASM